MANVCIQALKSQKGKDILVVDGYVMAISRHVGEKFYWYCVCKKEKKCNSTIISTSPDGNGMHCLIREMSNHCHAPDPGVKDIILLKNNLKQDAVINFTSRPAQIINKNLAAVPSTSACSVPNKNALRQILRRAKKIGKPKEPTTLEDIEVPEELRKVEGELFLVRDYKFYENERILLFTTKKNLELLSLSEVWLMDGTFQCCPLLFLQLYSIHGFVGVGDCKRIVPLAYGFVTRKTEECYLNLFRQLKDYASEANIFLEPQYIISDFELAAINAIRIEFPNSISKGCFFHFCQSLWRKIQQSGLSSRYGEDSEFALKLRHLLALAFLSPAEIPEAYQVVKEQVLPAEAENEITTWFEKYYITGKLSAQTSSETSITISRVRQPIFPPKLWSIEDSNNKGFPRTQNNVEGWHRRWNALLDNKKLGLYETIAKLIEEQINTKHIIEKANAAIDRTPPKKKMRQRNESIIRLCESKQKMSLLDFLRGIAIHSKL